ncbi:MAG: carbonic anhydrase [Nitrospira sp.]|nr:carbonic anhydrase [Nitrospira sp.]
MKKLIEGFKKFQREVFSSKQDLFSRLARGQHPRALFITCSDSRIDPCLITQTDPGDLFILRNAGNLVPSYGTTIGSTIATIEYAVGVLGVKNIIVCGHTDCGVVKAILEPEQVGDLPAVKSWLLQAEATRRVVRENYGSLTGDALYVATTQENVRIQLKHLQTHPIVAAKLRNGSVDLHGWVYSIETGEVWAYDFDGDTFQSLLQPRSRRRKRK